MPSRPRRPSFRDALARPVATHTTDGHPADDDMATANIEPPTANTAATEKPAAATANDRRAEMSKFTVLLTPDDAVLFDRLALELRRRVGHRIPKGDMIRALVAMAMDDASLRDQLATEMATRPNAWVANRTTT